MASIEIRNVGKQYAGRSILSDLSLALNDGECFTLLGPSGCGKTVLLRLIAGFETPDSGKILIGDEVVADAASSQAPLPPDKRSLGIVFQDYAVWPHMTVFDNIAYPLKLAKVEAGQLQARTLRAVELVGLTGLDQRFPSQLSGGQQQRVAVARALAASPPLILADEPTGNLDTKAGAQVFEIIRQLNAEGNTIVLITHDDELAKKAQRMVRITDGKIDNGDAPDGKEIF